MSSLGHGYSFLIGVNVNLDLAAGAIFIPGLLSGAAGVAGDGYGTMNVALPDDPALSGLVLYAQWFIWDSGAVAGAASTRSARLPFF